MLSMAIFEIHLLNYDVISFSFSALKNMVYIATRKKSITSRGISVCFLFYVLQLSGYIDGNEK